MLDVHTFLFGSPLTDARGHALRCALLGLVVALGRSAWWPGWPFAALLLGVFVVVPLGLALVAPPEPRGWHVFFWRAAVWLQLPAALLVMTATLLESGLVAALLTLPWFFVTVLVALSGLTRLLRRGARPLTEAAIDAGLIYVAVGGVWTVLSFWGESSLQAALWPGAEMDSDLLRVARRSVGFPQIMFELTAVHFHFAGFVLPLLTGIVGRARPGLTANAAAVGVIAGMPLVAVGITLTQLGYPEVEPWAAWLLAGSATLTAVLQIRHAGQLTSRLARGLLTVSGVSLIVAMAYAALYAWGLWSLDRFAGLPSLDIRRMLPFHGAVNAVGFALAGLVGWVLVTGPKAEAALAGPRG
jgi:hypothetical protein